VGEVNVPHPDPSIPGAPHPDPERLALAALPAEPDDPAVAEHLRGCAHCRAEVDDLRRTVELAREGGMGDVLPAPPDRVWRGIAAELGLPGERNGQVGGAHSHIDPPDHPGSDDVADGTNGAAPQTMQRPAPSTRRRRRILAPLLAAAIGLLAGLGVGRVMAPEPGPAPVTGPVVRLAPVGDLDPTASGTVAMADEHGERQMVVQVRGVTNIAGGDHLEAWLMDASGTRLVPLGALDGGDGDFHGTFALPEGVPLGVFGQVDVSAERWDGNPGHSTLSVLRGAF
jgi:hypothetical protein